MKRIARWATRLRARVGPRAADARKTLARLAAAEGDYAAMERWCERALRCEPQDTEALWMRGLSRLARNDAQGALPSYTAHADASGATGTITRIYTQRHLDRDRAKRGDLYYRCLDDVCVDTAYWSVMTRDGSVYSADVHGRNLANSPFVHGRVTIDGSAIIASYPAPRVSIDEECILVGGDGNYSHWLFRNLLKLVTLDRAGVLDRYPWLLNRDLAQHQCDYLDLLGVPPAQRVLVDRGQVVRCRRLTVPALLISKRAIAEGVQWIRGRLAPCLVPEAEADQLVYVPRSDAARRRIANEDELNDMLTARGFTVLVAGRSSVAEQIRVFSSARLIVAAHGAAMTNMIFAPAHAAYVELCSSNWADMIEFRRLAGARGQSIVTLVSDRYPGGARPSDPQADYCVDVPAVEKAVRELLGASSKARA